MTPGALRVDVSADIATFDAIWPRINQRSEAASYIFQAREQIDIWLDTIGAARRVRPYFVRVTRDGAPVMLLAMGIEPRHGARVLIFLDGGVCDYNAPILFPGAEALSQEDMKALWPSILAALPRFDAIVLEKAPQEINGRNNPLRFVACNEATGGYVVPLHGDYARYEATRLHRPKDSRRKRRRLNDSGALAFVVATTPAQVERLFAAFMRQKRRRYMQKNGVDGFDRPGYRAYFHAMTERLHAHGHIHLSALEVNGAPIATHWGLVSNGCFYCLMLAYEEGPLAQYSPARLLVEDLIAWSFHEKLHTFDLGVGDAPWKRMVGAERRPLAQVSRAVTPLGWAYLEAGKLRRRFSAGGEPATL